MLTYGYYSAWTCVFLGAALTVVQIKRAPNAWGVLFDEITRKRGIVELVESDSDLKFSRMFDAMNQKYSANWLIIYWANIFKIAFDHPGNSDPGTADLNTSFIS